MTTIKIDSKDWKNLLASARVYSDEATVKVGEGKARIMLVSASKDNMFYGEVDCEGETEFSVDLDKMMKAMSAVGNDIEIEVGDGVLTVYGQSTKVKVPIIVANQCPNWPPKFLNPTAYCDIAPSLLEPVLSYGKFCNQSFVKFIIDDTKMRIEIGSEYSQDVSEIICPNTAVGSATAVFSLDFIDTLFKHVKSCESVTVGGFENNVPMSFSWAEGSGKFRVLIAPRVED